MSQVFLFLDTNFLMEYKPFKDIDWPAVLGAKEVRLLITPTVTGELDIHKTGDKRKRNRAISVVKLLDELPEVSEPISIRKGVELQFIPKRYDDYAKFKLTDRGDDEILLNAIHFLDENPGSDVRILTGDRNFPVANVRVWNKAIQT